MMIRMEKLYILEQEDEDDMIEAIAKKYWITK